MLLKYFYDTKLAHASYLVGCQRTGEALIVDPGRDIQPYLDTAQSEEMRITAIAETHIHADYVSGARELAHRTGATLYLSDEGPPEWKYEFADDYEAVMVKEGDDFQVGNVRLKVMHTPGHTPESVSFILTDEGGGADSPMGIFTGDFVFVGSVGRPDLLEKAVGLSDSAKAGATEMFRSLERFKALAPHLQVWPAHGAGSACGKGLGAIPSSTVGYEVLFNPALQFDSEEAFIEYLLADQPEVPTYFKTMKRVNKEGPALLLDAPLPEKVGAKRLPALVEAGEQVVDLREPERFAAGHVAGTINIPLGSLAQWAGWLVRLDAPLTLVAPEGQLAEAVRVLQKLGIEQIPGYIDADALENAGVATARYEARPVEELADAILGGEVTVVDVRAESEWEEGRLPNATHLFLGTLPQTAEAVVNGQPIVVQCRTGARSAIGASILRAAGAENVINLLGGYRDWAASGLPIER